ncbi:MAG: iron-sulfur cluster assembly scaffold protein [Thermoplasmata archaeon]|nr:iron-sulfur cluster assembly scaffold protein [Thermoplasmata archaeon]
MSDSQSDSGFERLIEEIQKKITREEEALYSKEVLEEYREPRNIGRMRSPDASAVVKGSCGDTMEIYLRIEDNRAKRIEFMTDGCGPSVACGSRLTKMAEGKTLHEIERIEEEDLIKSLDGLPEENLHCAELSIKTLREAVRAYEKKRE